LDFCWYYVSKPVNAASCPKHAFRISDSTARELFDLRRVDFVTAMLGGTENINSRFQGSS